MKNAKLKIKNEKKNKKTASLKTPEVQNDFVDAINWEAEMEMLASREFESLEDALVTLAEAVAKKTFGTLADEDQIEFVAEMLQDNEEICMFLKKELKIRRPS